MMNMAGRNSKELQLLHSLRSLTLSTNLAKFGLTYQLYIINLSMSLIFSSLRLELASACKLPISTLYLLHGLTNITAGDIYVLYNYELKFTAEIWVI